MDSLGSRTSAPARKPASPRDGRLRTNTGDPPPSGDDRPGGVGFRRRRASRPHRRRRGRPRGLGAPHGEGQKKACRSSNRPLLHPAGRSGQIGASRPPAPSTGTATENRTSLPGTRPAKSLSSATFGRRKPRVGRSAPLHRQRQAHPHPGRGERFDTGSRRTQMGLHGAPWPTGTATDFPTSSSTRSGAKSNGSATSAARQVETRPGAARARGLGGRGPQTRLELVDARARHARHAMAHDARGDGLERRG